MRATPRGEGRTGGNDCNLAVLADRRDTLGPRHVETGRQGRKDRVDPIRRDVDAPDVKVT
jgi:hypothetical protein